MQYDANGIRYSKVVPANGSTTTTTYFYDGDKLVQEKTVWTNGSQTSTTSRTYLYNSQGLVGFVMDDTLYSYRKNLFGDIVAIYQGATKVAEYAYDAYGNCTIVSDTNNIGRYNPFRYRGYYYDTDLYLYYLMSRYYDPLTGRFINADSLEYLDPESINGLNLYAYCYNNPIMYADPSGHDPFLVIALLAASFIVGAGASAISQGAKYGWDNISVAQVGIDGLIALFSTALSMTGISMVGSILVGGAIGLGQYAIESKLHDVPTTWEGFISAFITGAVGGALSGAGARNHANVLANRQLTGKGASAFKAIATAGDRFLSGEISLKGFSATTRLWGKVLNDALFDATETTIRRLTINGASVINVWTVSNALSTCITHLLK